ncbi:type II toxin-antitoxin system RelB/DinJ family antitoxin [Desulfonatronum lacustre]|uniref:type II toxin-antitoxin system RelB/DinJ family antitoxin n=1 Tax=Desulfonatronum lacustre TaxID=66849 RepID=UPI00048CC8A6|nr:type II toxin-antitoxin system RelB/DinJ family antitoxin [Desulfonatronum lacustre]
MPQTSMLHVRVDTAMKDQAVQALGSMGLTVSDAVRILLKRIIADQAFPLELKVPNAETQAAMEEAREIMASRPLRFTTPEALMDDLEKSARK